MIHLALRHFFLLLKFLPTTSLTGVKVSLSTVLRYHLCVWRCASKRELRRQKSEKAIGEQEQLSEPEELSSCSRPAR